MGALPSQDEAVRRSFRLAETMSAIHPPKLTLIDGSSATSGETRSRLVPRSLQCVAGTKVFPPRFSRNGQLAGLRPIAKKGDAMKILATAFGLSSVLAIMGGSSMVPAVASADTVERTYVACNQYGDCWRVHQRYAYGPDAPITYYNSDWYDAHQNDANVHWRADPDNDRGYYERDGTLARGPGRARLGGRGGGRRYRRGNRVSRDASDWLRPWRGGWRRRGWRHGRRRRRSLDAARLIEASADRSGRFGGPPRAAREEVRTRPGLLSLVLVKRIAGSLRGSGTLLLAWARSPYEHAS